MKILFFNVSRFAEKELREFVRGMKGEAHFAASVQEAVAVLNRYPIDIFFLRLNGIGDAGLLKYASDNFREIRVVLTVEDEIGQAVSAIRQSRFDLLRTPFSLDELVPFFNPSPP